MATPQEQLVTIQANLEAARIAGDTKKIAALEKSQESVQSLVDINNGKFPESTTPYTASQANAPYVPPTPQSSTAPYGVREVSDGFVETSRDGTVIRYNSEGLMYSITDPTGKVTKSPTVFPDGEGPGTTAATPAAPNSTTQQVVSTAQQQTTQNAETPLVAAPPTVIPANSSQIAQGVDVTNGQNAAGQPSTPAAIEAPANSTQPAQGTSATTGQKEVPATEDPFEAARLAAIAEQSPSPTEQTVLSASSDPALTTSQRVALEEQQAANRAALQQEDATNRAAQVMVKPGAALDNAITAIPDWRVKLRLAKHGADYLYNAAKPGDILYPLKQTGGVVFPYTPQIQSSYKANYDPTDLTHSNYRMYFYKNSNVDDVTISCEFTAQDSNEASYMLAVIHFFKSATKMFYGQDKSPSAGTPPPLVFLSGYGQFQFNNHPMLISSFTYNLPNDVDYIRASTGSNVSLTGNGGAPASPNASYIPGLDFIKSRLLGANLNKGGASSQPVFTLKASGEPTYVPTKIQLQIQCLPVVTRSDISDNFSLREYAAGNLTKRSSGGIW